MILSINLLYTFVHPTPSIYYHQPYLHVRPFCGGVSCPSNILISSAAAAAATVGCQPPPISYHIKYSNPLVSTLLLFLQWNGTTCNWTTLRFLPHNVCMIEWRAVLVTHKVMAFLVCRRLCKSYSIVQQSQHHYQLLRRDDLGKYVKV